MANDKLTKNQTEEAMLAILALGTTTPNSAKGVVDVSQEELIALWHGELDATKRQRLLDAIAGSPDHYLRWVQLIEAQEVLSELPETDASEQQGKRSGMTIDRTSMVAWWRKPWIFGGAIAALLVVFLMPYQSMLTNDSRVVDQLYDNWYPGSPSPTDRSNQWRGRLDSDAKPEEQRYFEAGLLAGLNRLGDGFEFVGLPTYKLTEIDRPNAVLDENHAFLLGRLTTVLYFRCGKNQDWTSGDIKFFQVALELLSNIEEEAPNWRYFKNSNELTQIGSQPEDVPSILCSKSVALVEKVIRLNH